MTTATLPFRSFLPPARWVPVGFLVLLNVLFAAVGLVTKLSAAEPPDVTGLLVVAHLASGIVFSALGPMQLSQSVRVRRPLVHRCGGRVFVVAGAIAGFSALWLSIRTVPYGGYLLYTANAVFGAGMVLSLLLALRAILRRDVVAHRAWMIRAFAIGLVAATSRLYMLPQFLLVGEIDGPTVARGMWACFVGNVVVAEVFVVRRGRFRAGSA